MRWKCPETVKAGTAGTGEKRNLISHMSLRHREVLGSSADPGEVTAGKQSPSCSLRLSGWSPCMDEGLNLQNHCAGSRAISTGPTAALR